MIHLNEKVKSYLTKTKETLGKVSKKIWILLAVLLVVTAAVIAIVLNNRPYSVLFTDLSTEDLSAILTYLDEQGITNYQLKDGDTILVPENQENALKAAVLMQGYPSSGFGYSTYFDNVSALSTEAERNAAYLIALQERMGAVIECFDGVKSAVVNIQQGEDRSYVLDSSNVIDASAGVMVTMKSGKTLTKEQASAIRNLVARSVKGLEIDSITITDAYGNQYTDSGSTSDADSSALKLQLEEENNNKIRTSIVQLLEPIFGEGNVKVGVNCTVEVSHTVQNSTEVILPEGSTNGQGIIGSLIYDHYASRSGEDAVGGTVGTEENSDISIYTDPGLELDGTETDISLSGQIDYNNSTKETYVERTAGYISDCSVAVTINSKILNGEELDIAAIRAHVARAAGISAVVTETTTEDDYLAGKISVLVMPFYEEPAVTPVFINEMPEWAIYAAGGAAVLILILLLVIILMIRANRKRKKKLKEQEAKAALDQNALTAALAQMAKEREEVEQVGADVMALHSERSMELRKDIRQFADNNPEIAAQMVRLWLRGGEDDE